MTKASFAQTLNADNLSVGADLYMRDGATFSGGVILRSAKVSGQVSMVNAAFAKTLDADNLSVGADLYMRDGASFSGGVILRGAKVGGQLVTTNASFAKTLSADSLSVGTSLLMRDGTFSGDVILRGAKVSGQLDMTKASFAQRLDADALSVGADLYMRDGARFSGDVILLGAKVGGQLDMTNASFAQTLNADALSVGASLYMRDGATFSGDVILLGAKVGGQVSMTNASFAKTLNVESLSVGANLFMFGKTMFNGPVDLQGARISGSLYLNGATAAGLDFTGAVVTHELNIAELGWRCANAIPSHWSLGDSAWQHAQCGQTGGAALLKLRNAQVGALQDSDDAWPPSLDLEGFHYERLGGLGGTGNYDMRVRPPEHWNDWLARDPTFSTQPYAQLAGVLLAAGHRDSAERIQYAGRQRERDEALHQAQNAWRRGDGWGAAAQLGQWAWLSTLCVVTGYGIGLYTFRVLYWVLGLTVLGAIVLWYSPVASRRGVAWRLGASLHRLLPVVELNKEFKDFSTTRLLPMRTSRAI
jgi:hypothetical protein